MHENDAFHWNLREPTIFDQEDRRNFGFNVYDRFESGDNFDFDQPKERFFVLGQIKENKIKVRKIRVKVLEGWFSMDLDGKFMSYLFNNFKL